MSSEADSYVSHFFESSLSQINASVVHAFATCMVDLSISCALMTRSARQSSIGEFEADCDLRKLKEVCMIKKVAENSCRLIGFSKPRLHSFQHIVYKRQRHRWTKRVRSDFCTVITRS